MLLPVLRFCGSKIEGVGGGSGILVINLQGQEAGDRSLHILNGKAFALSNIAFVDMSWLKLLASWEDIQSSLISTLEVGGRR